MKKVEDVFLLITQDSHIHYGRYAKIIGINLVADEKWKDICYHVEHHNGAKDYVPVSEITAGNYKLVTLHNT